MDNKDIQPITTKDHVTGAIVTGMKVDIALGSDQPLYGAKIIGRVVPPTQVIVVTSDGVEMTINEHVISRVTSAESESRRLPPLTLPMPLGRTDTESDLARRARLCGYEGDVCQNCGQYTLVRNGTCLKCDTCGETSGCS
ncbi:MAG TPA: hypothetical protein VJJ24_01840 [Candidatus Paceibacterota bacterium]